jgi:hypothetical protein
MHHSGFVLVTLSRMRDERSFPGGRRTVDTLRSSGRHSTSLAFAHNLVLSEHALGETRFQYSRLTPVDATDSLKPVVLIETDDPRDVPGTANPLSRAGTLLTGSSNTGGVSRVEQRSQVQHTLSLALNRHQLRLGIDAHFINSKYSDLEDTTGTFNFASPADFLIGKASRFRQRFDTTSSIRNVYAGIFVQDDWRIRDGWTVSTGLRWDRETSLADRNNLGPRVAVAYDPTTRGSMVIRGGFGLFYNRVLLRTLDDFTLTSRSQLIDTNLPGAQVLLSAIKFPKVFAATAPQVTEFAIRETSFLRRIERGLRIPESYQAAIGCEIAPRARVRLEVNYVYNRGAHLWRESNVNAPRLPSSYGDFSEYLLSRDFDNSRDPVTGLRPITSTGNADLVRFDLSQTSSKTIESNGKRIVVFGLDNQSTSNSTSVLRAALSVLRPLRPRARFRANRRAAVSRETAPITELPWAVSRSAFRGNLRIAYTLSKLTDDGVVNTSSPLVVGGFRRERAVSLLDSRHRLVVNGSHQFPRFLGAVAVSATLSVNSPKPFSIGINGNDRNLDDVDNDRPQFAGDAGSIRWHRPGRFIGCTTLRGVLASVDRENG